MKKSPKSRELISLFSRYLLIILLGLANLFVFSFIFSFPTIKFVSFLLSLVGQTANYKEMIVFNTQIIQLIPACICLSAYYLLFILIFSTEGIKFIQRVKILIFSSFIFLVFNVLRIFILVLMLNTPLFNTLHMFLWYFVSTVAVFLIWILDVRLFKIKGIPIYSDFRYLFSLIKGKKRR